MELIINIEMAAFYKKIFIFCFLCGLYIPCVFSQDEVYVAASFIKRIEYNFIDVELVKEVEDELVIAGYQCNFGSKSDVEKLFFGDFNAPIEFFYAPSFESSTGFRIRKDSLNTSWILEYKHIPNYEKVLRKCEDKYLVSGIPADMMHSMPLDSIPLYSNELIWKQIHDESLKFFRVETQSFCISDQFAEKLYQKMVLFINNFKAKGRLILAMDGYSVTFRNVVDDEVWSLEIHLPEGDALKLVDFCRQIMTDIETNTFKESTKYIELLDELLNR
jgi:hypothetical protein